MCRFLHVPHQASQGVIDSGLGFCMLFRGVSTTLSVSLGAFKRVVGFALEFRGPLGRFLQIGTRSVVECPTVTDLPESTASG